MIARTVLITGASTGIGEACALNLDRNGFRVFAGVRTGKAAEKLRAGASDRLTPIFLDVVDHDSIEKAFALIDNEHGLDGLVNNAGVSIGAPLEFIRLDDVREQFEVNVFGQVAVTQTFLPLLRRAEGRIVNMSSISGRLTGPFLGPYSMSKFALEAFSDGLRRELRPWGIHVSCVEPGAIATPIWEKSIEAARKRISALPSRAHELYGKYFELTLEAARKVGENAVPAERVARVVHHALTSERPKTRFLVGRDAKVQALMRYLLPDRILDKVFRRFLKMN